MLAQHLGPVQLGVEHAAALAAGARDDQHVDALGDVPRHRRGTLARLVVRVRVHRHETQLLCQLRAPRLCRTVDPTGLDRLTCRDLPRTRRRPLAPSMTCHSCRWTGWEDGSAILADAADDNARRYPPVTETHATITRRAGIPGRALRPPPRHRRSAPPSLLAALALLALVATLTVIAVRLYRQYGDPVYDAQVITLHRHHRQAGACRLPGDRPAGRIGGLRAARPGPCDGAEVGREEVTVTADPGSGTVDPAPPGHHRAGRSSARSCAAARRLSCPNSTETPGRRAPAGCRIRHRR